MNNSQTHISNKIKAASLLLIAGLVIYLSVQMFLSSLYSLQTNLFLNDWQNKINTSQEVTFKPSDQAWLNANQASQKAINSYPVNNGFLQELAGKVYQWKTYDQPIADSNAQQNRLQALQAYRKQTTITPLWPKAWLNLLSIKIELNQYDNEFYHAYNQIKLTSNHNPEITPLFIQLGIQAWQNLNNKTQSDMLKIITQQATSSQTNALTLKPILQANNLLALTCVYAKATKQNTYNLCKE
ncbi:hypothetical protein JCM30760_03400 [Thiomicrorhabdus hydrogeniphila]